LQPGFTGPFPAETPYPPAAGAWGYSAGQGQAYPDTAAQPHASSGAVYPPYEDALKPHAAPSASQPAAMAAPPAGGYARSALKQASAAPARQESPGRDTSAIPPPGDEEESGRHAVSPPNVSEIGKKVLDFVAEAHDCSLGPLMCTVVDLYQSFSAAKVTGERLAEMAEQESEAGQTCQSYVEYDDRFFVARYTLIGSTSFLLRCLKLIG
jgi:hypothetical protein